MSHRKGSGIVTQEMISKIKELRSNLVTIEDIASELKCSKSLINRVIKESNLLYPKTIVIPRKSLKNQPIDGNKKCSSCKEVLPVEMFVNNNKSKSKKNPSCKKCQNELYLKNKDKIKARSKAYRESNSAKLKEYHHQRYLDNTEEYTKKANEWRRNNPERFLEISRARDRRNQKQRNAALSARRAKQKNRTPAWADKKEIENFFKNCPVGHHVDHIIPINSDFVSGLHVVENLRYVPENENMSKGNMIVDDLPVGECYQYRKRVETENEDRNNGFNFTLKVKDFVFTQEKLTKEHRDFIERYEWLGNIGYSPKWVFTARHDDQLAGVVMIGEPTMPTSHIDTHLQAQITRGACASWAPKNLNSSLVMFSIRWCAKNTEKKVFYAYSDHEAGEIGTIYQACNFDYLGAFFGRSEVYTLPNGKEVGSRYFKKTSTIKRYAKELNIEIKKEWYKNNGYIDLKLIPTNIMSVIKQRGIEEMGTCEIKKARRKGKYMAVLGKDSRETRVLKSKIQALTYPYPKRGGG